MFHLTFKSTPCQKPVVSISLEVKSVMGNLLKTNQICLVAPSLTCAILLRIFLVNFPSSNFAYYHVEGARKNDAFQRSRVR